METFSWIKTIGLFLSSLGFLIGAFQFRIAKKHGNISTLYLMIERLESVRDLRHKVYDLKNVDYQQWTIEDKEVVDKVCREFDILGVMNSQRLIPKSFLKTFYAVPTVRCWVICKEYIEDQRKIRLQPTHMIAFEKLAIKSRKLRPDSTNL